MAIGSFVLVGRVVGFHDPDGARLHASGVAAGSLPRLENRHEALGELSFRRFERPCHGLHNLFAGEDVSLHRIVLTLDVPRPVAAVGPGVGFDASLVVDHRNLSHSPAFVRFGQSFDDLIG